MEAKFQLLLLSLVLPRPHNPSSAIHATNLIFFQLQLQPFQAKLLSVAAEKYFH